MIERYSFVEDIFTKGETYDQGLSLRLNDNSALRIVRMLSGTCSIKDDFFGSALKLRHNFLDIPSVKNSRLSKSVFRNCFPEEVTFDDLASYFRALRNNDEFYKLIEVELISCLWARSQGRYLEAFFFLYRLLEGISYSVPLMYISKSRSFSKSFKALQKSMPSSEKEGELLFLKKFIDEQWSYKAFFNVSLDINLAAVEVEEMRSAYYKKYKGFIPKEGIDTDVEDEILGIRFPYFRDFLINLRNRYFHFLQGAWQKNIETGEVLFPDMFFKPIVDPGINWIAVCLFEVIAFDIENHSRYAGVWPGRP